MDGQNDNSVLTVRFLRGLGILLAYSWDLPCSKIVFTFFFTSLQIKYDVAHIYFNVQQRLVS